MDLLEQSAPEDFLVMQKLFKSQCQTHPREIHENNGKQSSTKTLGEKLTKQPTAKKKKTCLRSVPRHWYNKSKSPKNKTKTQKRRLYQRFKGVFLRPFWGAWPGYASKKHPVPPHPWTLTRCVFRIAPGITCCQDLHRHRVARSAVLAIGAGSSTLGRERRRAKGEFEQQEGRKSRSHCKKSNLKHHGNADRNRTWEKINHSMIYEP